MSYDRRETGDRRLLPARNDAERPWVQRDWLGHGIQLALIFVGLGVPLAVWGSGINATIAKIDDRATRQDRDSMEIHAFQIQTTNQMLDISRQLATIVERVSTIRDNTAKRR